MILAFLGGLVILFTIGQPDKGITGFIVGGILILLGICAMNYHTEEVKARVNRRKYWAAGGPDRNRRYCPECGRSVRQNDRYCGRCGRRF